MGQPSDESNFIASSLPWKEILEVAQSDRFGDQFDSIPNETLEFAADENNHATLVESALKSLETSDPENANREYAEKLAEVMRKFASKVLSERQNN